MKRKGFWAALFAPQTSCCCSCGSNIIEEVDENTEKQPETSAEKKDENKDVDGKTKNTQNEYAS